MRDEIMVTIIIIFIRHNEDAEISKVSIINGNIQQWGGGGGGEGEGASDSAEVEHNISSISFDLFVMAISH